ncbi:phosphate acyltransferase PlsX [Virgisporangium ochraceum]|uniref:Phosphate acyltransferase n=1 Tax=Virgisporangium ochraceum TaxID=65505 RepID=A0A8J4EC61_9ACTN|nr:phosphate acyltransferase PlsX [Virgisporangium ochraceum]GIJ69309.1 phosphate acyltransferase [Virgisporangium ochraceum]
MTDSSRRGAARIAVDLLGGDAAPAVVVDGALRAADADPDLSLLLVGPQEVADEIIAALPPDRRASVEVDAVRRVVGMADSPLRAVRSDTTVRAGVAAVAAGRAGAVVTAGASGAAVTAAVHGLGRQPGVRRPALCVTLPALRGPVVLLDVGAGLDLMPSELAVFAQLGATYAAVLHGITAPRVGLLSIGAEPGKGDKLRKVAAVALADATLPPGARYTGYVEGHDVTLGGHADVVVTDGFTGNVLLKGIEGAYALAAGHETASGPPVSVPRAAVLLGVPGNVVVCHGAAEPKDVADGIALATTLHHLGLSGRMAAALDPPARAPVVAEVRP